MQTVVCLIISLGLAYMSWYYIEVPFRRTFIWVNDRFLTYMIFTIASLLLFILGFIIYRNNGFPERFVENRKFITINKHVSRLVEMQTFNARQIEKGEALLKLGTEKVRPSFLIWGDSHALGFSTTLDISARKHNLSGYFLTKSGTAPILYLEDENDLGGGKLQFNNKVMDFIKNNTEIKTVFLSCRWSYHFNGPYVNEPLSKLKYIDSGTRSKEQSQFELLRTGLRKTVQKLLDLNRNVVIINQVPEQKYDVAKYFIKKRIYGMFKNNFLISSISETDYKYRNWSANSAFKELENYPRVTILHIDKIFKSENGYLTIVENNPLYTDNNHLSIYGLNYTQTLFDQYFQNPR